MTMIFRGHVTDHPEVPEGCCWSCGKQIRVNSIGRQRTVVIPGVCSKCVCYVHNLQSVNEAAARAKKDQDGDAYFDIIIPALIRYANSEGMVKKRTVELRSHTPLDSTEQRKVEDVDIEDAEKRKKKLGVDPARVNYRVKSSELVPVNPFQSMVDPRDGLLVIELGCEKRESLPSPLGTRFINMTRGLHAQGVADIVLRQFEHLEAQRVSLLSLQVFVPEMTKAIRELQDSMKAVVAGLKQRNLDRRTLSKLCLATIERCETLLRDVRSSSEEYNDASK